MSRRIKMPPIHEAPSHHPHRPKPKTSERSHDGWDSGGSYGWPGHVTVQQILEATLVGRASETKWVMGEIARLSDAALAELLQDVQARDPRAHHAGASPWNTALEVLQGAAAQLEPQQRDRLDRAIQSARSQAGHGWGALVTRPTAGAAGGGRPLEKATRDHFEPRFGVDFSQVRVHDDRTAHEEAAKLNARAFTVGNDVSLAEGQPSTDTQAGQRLLAHELTHVVQQTGADHGVQGSASSRHDTMEQEANRAAAAVVAGRSVVGQVTPRAASGPQLQSKDEPLQSLDPSEERSIARAPAVPSAKDAPGIDPLIAPVVDDLETLKRLPSVRRSKEAFGGDKAIDAAAHEIAGLYAERKAPGQVEERFKATREKAKTEGKHHVEEAVRAAAKTAPRAEHRAAEHQARVEAERAVAATVAAIQRENPGKVQAELELSDISRLQEDFDLTLSLAFDELSPAWLSHVHKILAHERQKLTSHKGKHASMPDPAVVEATMAEKRIEQALWLSHQIERVKHAWVVGKQQELQFKTHPLQRPPLEWKGFGPEREVPAEERVPITGETPANKAGVASELRGFLDLVAARVPGLDRENYSGHGGGSFRGAGFSADLTLPDEHLDERGFYPVEKVVGLLRAIDDVAAQVGAQWRVLYNDHEVARRFNPQAKSGYVQFMGQARLGNTLMLNWHGPSPLKLHLHLDVSVRTSLPASP